MAFKNSDGQTVMRILVTGGSGFLGSHIVEDLADRGYDVISADLYPPTKKYRDIEHLSVDVCNFDALSKAIRGCDAIYNCAGIADLLIIDEAGQLPLADAVAVSTSARRVVALGDPQQLAAPIQAAHDDSVQVSLLEHIAQGRPVLPTEVGVFLDVTYRMHPGVCAVIADLA